MCQIPANRVAIRHCDSYQLGAVHTALNQLFIDIGLDENNPLGQIIKPGMTVFIKPNWVASRWRESCPYPGDLYAVITHPAVIEAVADRVAEALQGQGKIIIGDNPSIDADFTELMSVTGIRQLETKYDVPCEIYDLRPLVCPSLDVYGKKGKMVSSSGDPNGSIEVNLGKKSMLYSVDSTLFRGVFDERQETVESHTGENQRYTFAKSIYDADVFISIPKLKTHQKVGNTLNLKGLVGTITNKNQLVHWRIGTPETGGDEYPDLESYEKAQQAKVTHRGAWPGNDTIWRMVADLYQCFTMNLKQKRFTIIDGILAGEGQGPFCPTTKYATSLIAGMDFLFTDIAASRYMGLNPHKIKYLSHFIDSQNMKLDDTIEVILNGVHQQNFFTSHSMYKNFGVLEQWKEIKIIT